MRSKLLATLCAAFAALGAFSALAAHSGSGQIRRTVDASTTRMKAGLPPAVTAAADIQQDFPDLDIKDIDSTLVDDALNDATLFGLVTSRR